MKTNFNAPIVPCHRVLASDGKLTVYSGKGGVASKKKMLMKEGVILKAELVNLPLFQWKP